MAHSTRSMGMRRRRKETEPVSAKQACTSSGDSRSDRDSNFPGGQA